MPDVAIRQAVDEDAERIVEIWIGLMDYHRDLDDHFNRRSDGHVQFDDFLRTNISSESSIVLVATVDGSIVGYTMAQDMEYPPVFEVKRYCFITDIMIVDGHRGSGIGSNLVSAVRDWASERGLTRAEVNVHAFNEMGLSFWRSMGFFQHTARMRSEIDPGR